MKKGIGPLALIYPLAALLIMLPAVSRFGDCVFADVRGGGDSLTFLWNLWWMKRSLLELHRVPFWTDYLCHPLGTNLLFHSLTPINELAGLPLQIFLPLPAVYNLLLFGNLCAAAIAACLLANYLTGNRHAALVSGYIFGFSPYLLGHVYGGHLNVVSVAWLPMYALFLLKSREDGRTRNALLAGLFLACAALTCWYYAAYALLFTILFLASDVWAAFPGRRLPAAAARAAERVREIARRNSLVAALFTLGFSMALIGHARFIFILLLAVVILRTACIAAKVWNRVWLKQLAMIALVFSLITGPLIAAMLYFYATSGFTQGHSSTSYSAPLLSFLVPGGISAFGEATRSVWEQFISILESSNFVGILAPALCIMGLRGCGWRKLRLWVFVAATFFCLSLGPYLKVGPRPIEPRCLPYGVLESAFPIMRFTGVPVRMHVMVMLCIAVLAGYGASCLMERLVPASRRNARILIAVLLVAGVALEYLPCRMVPIEIRVPQFFRELGKEEARYAVLDARAGELAMLGQTAHGKPLVSCGLLARQTLQSRDHMEKRPFINRLYHLTGPPPPLPPRQRCIDILRRLDVRYVILASTDLKNREIVADYVGLRACFSDGDITAYAVPQRRKASPPQEPAER